MNIYFELVTISIYAIYTEVKENETKQIVLSLND